MKEIGEYKDFRTILDRKNVKRGYAFISVHKDSVDKFLDVRIEVDGAALFVNFAKKKCDKNSLESRLYFMTDLNKSVSVDSNDISDFFSTRGNVQSVHLYRNHQGKFKNYGFCDFKTKEEKVRVLDTKN